MQALRTLATVAIAVITLILAVDWAFSSPAADIAGAAAEAQTAHTAPTTATPIVAAPATPAPTPTLSQLGAPVRVQFELGTYGSTLQVSAGQTTYALWARSGQVMTLTSNALFAVRMTSPTGADVTFDAGRVVLPATGDYLLTVAGDADFSFTIEIR